MRWRHTPCLSTLAQNCSALGSLGGLSALRTIGGTASTGLVVRNNDALRDMKPLEDLSMIRGGGVDVTRNDGLCYVDLMPWSHIVEPNTPGAAKRINVVAVNASCSLVTCGEGCFCGHCGGPGQCHNQQFCRQNWYDRPGWVKNSDGEVFGYAVMIIVAFTLSVVLVALLVSCAVGWSKMEVQWATSRPPRKESGPAVPPSKAKSVPPKPRAWRRTTSKKKKGSGTAETPQEMATLKPQTPASDGSQISLPRLKQKDSDTVGDGEAELTRDSPLASAGPPMSSMSMGGSHHSRRAGTTPADTVRDGEASEAGASPSPTRRPDTEPGRNGKAPADVGVRRESSSLSNSFGELSRPAANDIAATVLVAAQMRKRISMKAKDVNLNNAPASLRELAMQGFAPQHEALLELETAVKSAASASAHADAAAKLKRERQKVHQSLQQRRKSVREQIDQARRDEDPAAKRAAVSSMIVVRLQLELLQRMVQDFEKSHAEDAKNGPQDIE